MSVFQLRPDSVNFRHLVSDTDWRFDSQFMWGRTISEELHLRLRYRTQQDDVNEQEELVELGESNDEDGAIRRFSNGPGDCAFVLNFTMGLVFSKRAIETVGDLLRSSGQLFECRVDGDEWWVYNCTQLIDAVDCNGTDVVRLSDGCPTRFRSLAFVAEKIVDQFLFKVEWPRLNGSYIETTTPPPRPIWATQQFVDVVRKNELTGFEFRPITNNFSDEA